MKKLNYKQGGIFITLFYLLFFVSVLTFALLFKGIPAQSWFIVIPLAIMGLIGCSIGSASVSYQVSLRIE